MNIFPDGINIFNILSHRVGIIKPQIAFSVDIFVQFQNSGKWPWHDRYEDIRWVPGETGMHPVTVFTGAEIFFNDFLNKIQ